MSRVRTSCGWPFSIAMLDVRYIVKMKKRYPKQGIALREPVVSNDTR